METLQLEPAERERLLKQLLMDLGTNQTLVLQVPATAPDTNTVAVPSAGPLAEQTPQAPAGKVPGSTAPTPLPASGSKGATSLVAAAAKSASKGKKAAPARLLPTAPGGAPLTPEQIEAKLVAAIQVSVDDQRELINQRAQAVQSSILKTGQVAAERLFIIAPKPAAASAAGEPRANLSLD